jgi:hypothetical protein
MATKPPLLSTHGVLIAGVHLTYPSRSTANRVRRALHAFVDARPQATRAELERAASIAACLDGKRCESIVESCLNVARSDARGKRWKP